MLEKFEELGATKEKLKYMEEIATLNTRLHEMQGRIDRLDAEAREWKTRCDAKDNEISELRATQPNEIKTL